MSGEPLLLRWGDRYMRPDAPNVRSETPIGGLRMIDGNEADDKIIAVMRTD